MANAYVAQLRADRQGEEEWEETTTKHTQIKKHRAEPEGKKDKSRGQGGTIHLMMPFPLELLRCASSTTAV